jgi:hypothetical protein
MISEEAANTNCVAFDLTQQGFEPIIYSPWGKNTNHCTTNVVDIMMQKGASKIYEREATM